MTLLFAASVFRTIGILISLVVVGGFVVYGLINIRAGRKEIGSEIELAANRKPYYDDDVLEGKKLDRSLGLGLATLAVVGIGLPLYWLQEPARQENAVGNFDRIFEDRGAELYEEACASCHGPEGVGGLAAFTVLDPEDNSFVAQVNWKAPAIDTVLQRYSVEEVTEVLNYGRPFSPMPAWGEPGGGAFTSQQIEEVIAYLAFIQPPAVETQDAALEHLTEVLGSEPDFDSEEGLIESGEILFNLGREDGFAGGAYSCGRCHTQGWSISADVGSPNFLQANDVDQVAGPAERTSVVELVSAQPGSGAYGPNLTNGATLRQFPTFEGQVDFIIVGSQNGQLYGRNGQGSGGMPGFGDNPNTLESDDGMLTREMIRAIVAYERTL
jgi:mono/diheme cytochrome c family protein